MAAALTLDGISKRYGGFQAVSDLSFEVEKGTICGFLGPNGAGKTSTLRMILGLQPATTGRIDILGADDGRKVRDRIGFLPEERGLYKKMTPVDAIAFFGGLKGLPASEGRKRARDMLEQMGLGDAQKKKMKDLSKGMAQKVQLIASVVHRPEFVILDEPFSGLDPMNQQGLEAMIRALAADGATVLFSTHVMQHAERLCDKVVLLARGKKAFEGTVDQARATSPRFLELEGTLDPAAVAALPGVSGVEVLNDHDGARTLRAGLGQGAGGQEALKSAFLTGLDVRRFQIKEPTLHDAFIALTGDHPDEDQSVSRDALKAEAAR
ncbi:MULTISPECIES: ABC transporter ATP-binding protein [unclassified Brevundimonas]|uniref:ABC transporter ATP-binding protein n=1 Tax=unclassified Brevundimonas TaxID=2622653 RepID=UPI000CFAC1EF|nr:MULTISPECIES: ATP-binding cassette domain-containing protein [unclassified Brevundimonas]PRA26492.1 ABC transporter ATP-binding protein [Brevundimonas sp. MYb27]PQZ83207.1 ABC transporter ATP-binding protein [Brevundimonas sp. MYb31]PRB16259.1 ABC transporter ATP-binding protein [Brevundimonas sp. MYb52]PRB35129.1 ABC transporter ATP-binding protein [Brevundimonas sp. MYb46]PRB49814.1 ABC transporter ATP-binding protein [Brevundimonas sp. MYb33]